MLIAQNDDFPGNIWCLFQYEDSGLSLFQENLVVLHIKIVFPLFCSFFLHTLSVVSVFSLPSKGITQKFIYPILINNT